MSNRAKTDLLLVACERDDGFLGGRVENQKVPDAIRAAAPGGDGMLARACPAHAYLKTAIYNGSGSMGAAVNFTCGGNLETPEIVAEDALVPLKKENGTGVLPANFR